MMMIYIMILLCCYMLVMVHMTRIPLAWLQSNVGGSALIISDYDSEQIQITELQNNVFKQLSNNITTVKLHSHLTLIEPHAFAGLEHIEFLELKG